MARRRFERFSQNRRGWWSLWLFIGLFILTLSGELIANDKSPLVLSYSNELYFRCSNATLSSSSVANWPFQADYRDYVQKLIKQDGG